MDNTKFKKQISVKMAIALILIASLISSGIVYVFAVAPTSTFTFTSGIYPGAPSYTIWKDSNGYFAKDANGLIAYSHATNAAAVIQAAHDALANGGLISIKDGTFICASNIVISNSNISFEGVGDGTKLQAVSGCTMMFYVHNARFTKIRNMRLDGNNTANIGIMVDTGGISDSSFIFENILAHNALIDIFRIDNSAIGRISKVHAHTSGNILDIRDTAHIWVSDCDFGGTTAEGIYTNHAVELWLTSVKIDLAGTSGIYLSNVDEKIFMSNIYVTQPGQHGIRIGPATGPIIINGGFIREASFSAANTYDGIRNENCHNVICTGVRISDVGNKMRYGINDSGNNCVWIGNSISDAQTAAGVFTGSGTIVRHNKGYVTENSGSVALSTNSSRVVTHGLAGTPTNVQITLGFSYDDYYYVTTVGATTFTITFATTVTGTVYWSATYKS